MINRRSIETLQSLKFNDHFVRPAYGSYCFAHFPDTLKSLFGLPGGTPLPVDALPAWQGYEQVVFFFVDGFGWKFFEEQADRHPFLREMLANGLVSQLTSMFPSTTAAHTACIHGGFDLATSGIHEWFYYEPVVDEVIAPLLFSLAGQKEREQLSTLGFKGSQIIPAGQLYPSLSAAGIKTHVFNHYEFAFSSFSNQVCQAAKIHPYVTLAESLASLRQILAAKSGPTYIFHYYPGFDTIAHRYGPRSPQGIAELMAFLDQMERFVHSIRHLPRTLLLISADHGLSNTDPATTVYLNKELPGLETALRTNRRQAPILFGGSPRDLFLYVQPARLEEIHSQLSHLMAGRGETYLTSSLSAQGFFGPNYANPALQSRLGNLVVLPYLDGSVFWFEQGRFEQIYYGHHGGLTPDEMLIPLFAYPTG